jgi:hypothetical protein
MNEHRNIGPNLDRIRKDSPFKVPDRYFEDFSARLDNRIRSKTKAPVPVRNIQAWKPYLAAAAILFAVLITGNYYFRGLQARKADRLLHAEISRVVEQDLYSISEDILYEALEKEDPGNSDQAALNKDAAIDYLLNEGLRDEELITDF